MDEKKNERIGNIVMPLLNIYIYIYILLGKKFGVLNSFVELRNIKMCQLRFEMQTLPKNIRWSDKEDSKQSEVKT